MDNTGLTSKFPVNRPPTSQEKEVRLNQKIRLAVEPHYQLCVIKANSIFLESIDKWYGEKGLITAIVIAEMLIFGITFGSIVWMWAFNELVNYAIGVGIVLVFILTGLTYLLKKESFAYTHYPMRFNRSSRTVHVFQPNGTVLSAPWDEIFFTMGQADNVHKFWNVFGHILAEDRLTVIKTFALSVSETSGPDGITLLKSHWEFIRRYMEDGPEPILGQVEFCLPISERRESFVFGVRRMLANSSSATPIMYPVILLSMIFSLTTVPFRYFAIRTSKIPRWPAAIEQECAIPSNDPYAIYGDSRGGRCAVFPAAASAAGVMFKGAPKNPLRN